jgi:DNA-binding XRE family transcriptional regulator
MLECTKKRCTEVTLVFTGPAQMQAKAVELMNSVGFAATGHGRPWRLAFPEFAGNEQGTVLRGARLKQGLSQKTLAERTGIPQRHISEMETGKRTIGKSRAEKLAGALDVADYRVFL